MTLPLIQNQNQSNEHTIPETFTKKYSLGNLIKFHSGIFKLEILKIFTPLFLLKLLSLFQVLRCVLLENEKESSHKRYKPPKNCLAEQKTEEIYWKKR